MNGLLANMPFMAYKRLFCKIYYKDIQGVCIIVFPG